MKKIVYFILLITPTLISAQRVQMSRIPGQDSDLDINDMLNQIMAPHYSEITNLQNRRTDKEIEYDLWQDFKRTINGFEQVNRYIIGYESSFRSLTNIISDPTALNVQTTRTAKIGDYRVTINQLASAHVFSSAPISNDTVISRGKFSVVVADKTNNIDFTGGSLVDLYNNMRSSVSNEIEMKILDASSSEKVLSFIGKKEGRKHRVEFIGDIEPLIEIKVLTRGEEQVERLYWVSSNTNTIITNSSKIISTDYPIQMPTILSFTSKLEDIPTLPVEESNTLSLSQLSPTQIEGITNNLITLPGATPIFDDIEESIEDTITPEYKQQVIITFDDNSKHTINLKNDQFTVDLGDYQDKTIKNISALAENKILNISELRLVAKPEGSLVFYNESVKAQDAQFLLDGLPIQRPSNSVSDLISGVTLEFLQENRTNVRVQIKPDIELIKDTIIQWVMNYNNIMEDIFEFTTIPLNQIGRMKPLYLRKEDGDNLKEGSFYGNSSLVGFKDRMRRLAGMPHGLDPNAIGLLDQIGIYIRRRNAANNDPDALRKGTLTLDVNELERSLNEKFDEVKNLFAIDTDNNSTPDKGVAINALDSLQSMVGNNGYLTRIEQNNTREMKDMNTQIAKKEDEITRVSRKERQELMQMNQALIQSKALSESLKQRFSY